MQKTAKVPERIYTLEEAREAFLKMQEANILVRKLHATFGLGRPSNVEDEPII